MKLLNKKGFTILELMIATAIFSVILLVGATMMIQIGRMYYKGVTSTRVQENSREIIDDVSRAIQFLGQTARLSIPSGGGDTHALCIGDIRYSYKINNPTPKDSYGIWKDNWNGVCEPVATDDGKPTTDGKELLGNNSRVMVLNVSQNNNLWKVRVYIISGDSDLINWGGNPEKSETDPIDINELPVCDGQTVGSQWCAVSNLETEVTRRII
jgi:prepilin-type N-terminal cleavage/methylation domain-containing protein